MEDIMMNVDMKQIRLDKLNIPAESLRKFKNPGSDELLKKSIDQHGIFVPLIVSLLGKGEYAVWDGTRRLRMLQELGKPGSFRIASIIMQGGDTEALIAQININQIRERLSLLAEASALKQLVEDQLLSLSEAARKLLKSRSWATDVMKVWTLPKQIVANLLKGRLGLSHTKVIARYMDKPKIMNLLYKEALKGNIAHNRLSSLGIIAEKNGVLKAGKLKPRRIKISKKSWLRVEPLNEGVRVELHLHEEDSTTAAVTKITEFLNNVR
ncbi:MAG: ParB/RepB/Spo0J family partition protein [Bacteroidetes bacterium]|nr:ParB/RepB/Spo0J family partition protein [Bacteroidota bacterium]